MTATTQLQPTTQLLYQHQLSIYTSEYSTKSTQQLSLWNASQSGRYTHTTKKETDRHRVPGLGQRNSSTSLASLAYTWIYIARENTSKA